MSSKPYREIIRETITRLDGKATVFQIYDFIEKNYSDFIEGKEEKTWRNTVRFNLSTGKFHQKDDDKYHNGYKYWHNNSSISDQTPEEILQKEFEEALEWIHSNKEYQEMLLDYYLDF